MRRFIGILLTCLSMQSFAQLPVIDKIEPLTNYPNLQVLITGRGFSTNMTQLQVWFGNMKGTITLSSEFSIQVNVPPQARLDNIEVIHLVSKLSAKSSMKFVPAYSGEGFDPSKLETLLVDDVSRFPGDRVFDICSCDLDGDGKPDLAGTKDVNPLTDLVVLKNNSTTGSILFEKFDKTDIANLNLVSPTGYIACGDLNGDGKPELVASREGTTKNSVFVIPNTSSPGALSFGTFLSLNLESASDIARQISLNDLNDDGKPEIIVANSFSNIIYIYQNQSSGGVLSINPTPVKITVLGASGTLALEVQDFNGDGKPDIAATQNQTNNLFFLRNQSASTISFAAAQNVTLTGSFTDINSADFNRDGKLDIVVTSVFNARAIVLLNQSTSTAFIFTTAATLTTDTGPFGIDVNDINGDQRPDIIIPTRGTNAINVFLHDGSATPGFTRVNIATPKNNWFTKVGDLDGDAKPDIAHTSFNATGTQFSVDILRNKNCHLPKILNDAPLAICPGQTITLRTIPIPGVTFEWNDGTVNIPSGSTLNITTTGNYTVTATGEGIGCVVTSTPVFAVTSGVGTIPTDPVINSNAPLCTGSTLNLTTNTVAGATYIWTGPNNFTSGTEDPSIPGVTRANAGMYSLKVKIGDCVSNTATHRVDVVDLASFAVGSNAPSGIICQGQTATLSVNSEPGYSYQWIKDGTDIIPPQVGTSLGVTAQGSYSVRVSRTSIPTCSVVTPAMAIDVYTSPVAAFTVDLNACMHEQLTFTDQSTFDSRATIVYGWDFDDGGTSTIQNPTHAYTTNQTFDPVLTVTYSGIAGCLDTDTKSVVISNAIAPTIIAEPLVTEICSDGSEIVTLSVAGAFTTFNWSTGATTASIQVDEPDTYSVTTTDASGCTGNADLILTQKPGCTAGLPTIPKVFTPNGDSANDLWVISSVPNIQECTINVFDGRGRRIFESASFPVTGWDGVANGKPVPEGTYYYVFACPSSKPVTGSVLIVR